MKLRNTLLISLFLVPALGLSAGCGDESSPTGPGGGSGSSPFSGPEGFLQAAGSAAFGPVFEPGHVEILEIGVARGLQYFTDDDRVVAVFFNTTNLLVTKVGAGMVRDSGDLGWDLDEGIGEPVPGVTVVPDGDEWIVRFHHTELPGAYGTTAQLTLYGELRSDL